MSVEEERLALSLRIGRALALLRQSRGEERRTIADAGGREALGPGSSFAEALSWLRVFFGLSPGELAEIAGLSASTIRALEGGRRSPRRDTCYLIARRLQTLFNQELICAGHRGVRAFWDPPRTP